MARIFMVGFEVANSTLCDNYPLSGGSPHAGYCPGRTGRGRAYSVARPSGSYYVSAGSPAGTYFTTQYERFYLRIRRRPTTGPCRVWSNFTTTGGNSLILNLKTDGTLELFNVARSLGVSAVLTLDQWYRIELKAVCNTAAYSAPDPPFEDNSSAELRIDGAVILNVSPTNNGAALLGIATRNCQVYRSYLGGESVLADAEYDLDDWVADSAAWPGAGQVTALRVTGQGTYAEFTGDWRRVAPLPGSTTPTSDGVTSTTASARTTYTVEAFADKGITGTINAAQVGAFIWSLGAVPSLGLRVNGADNWTAVLAGAFNAYVARYLSAPGITVGDTLEIGYRKGADANAHYVSHLSLLIDHDSPDPSPETDTTIQTVTGTYAGNGTGQTVALTFEPDLLIIRRVGAAGIGLFWHKGMGDRGAYPSGPDGMGISGATTRLALVGAAGFDVGPDVQTNTTGATYWFLAIRDRTERMMATGGLFPSPSIDNWDVALSDPAFLAEILFAQEQFSTGSGDVYFRGPSHVGDLATELSAASGAPVANAIQSVGAGTFQLGTILTTSVGQRSYVGMKTGIFVQNRLLAVTSYVGTGIAVGDGRDIALDLGGRTPEFVLIIPHAGGTARYFKTSGNAGEDAQNWNNGNVQVTYAIKSLTADTVRIGYILDAIGVTHTVLSLTSGADVATIPEETFPDSWSGETVPLLWAELALDTGTVVYAKIDLPDPATYYGGYKQARILTAGAIKRALSDRLGNYEAAEFSFTLSDLDRVIRGKLGATASKWFLNRFVTLRMISDEYRRALKTPRVVGIGYIRDYAPISPLSFSVTCEDYLAIFVGLGQNEKQVPKRTITVEDFDGCPEPNRGKPVPVVYGNLSDAGSDEGPVQNVQAAEVSLGYPVANLAGVEGVAGTLVNGSTIQVKVTAVGDDGKEYDFSDAISVPVGTGVSRPIYDATITPPEMMGMHHLGGAGTFTSYRWGLVTALMNVAGVWHESDPGGWGDVHGDTDPNLAANCMMKVNGTPDRVRFYIFNVNDFSALGFHPTRNPDCPVGVAGDPASPKIVRIVEADLAGVVYSTKTGGRVDADYFGPGTSSPWGDVTGEGITHYANIYGDADGDDFYTSAVGASLDLTWDAWTPPAGVALATYRVYYTDGSDWRYFDEPTTAVSLTALDQGVSTGGGSYVYAVTGVFGSDQTVPSAEASGSFGVRKVSPGIRITWNGLQGADSYFVYRRNAGGGGPDAPTSADLYNRRWPVSGKNWMIDDLQDTGAEVIDGIPKAQGILPATYVGDVTLSGSKWRRFLVCGHAVKQIVSVYQKDATEDDYVQVTPGQFGTDFLAPGGAEWGTYFATDYLDINGHRYTLIYARGPLGDAAADGTRPLRVNLKGIEDVGDGSGTLIEDGFTQYLHAMRNWILQDYQTGAWAATGPAWPDSFSLGATEVLDDASFAEASAVAALRLVGGYKGAFVMGADQTQDTVRTWIQRFNLSLDAFAGFNRKSQFFVRLIDTRPTVLATAQKFTQVQDIVQGTWKVTDRPADLENVVAYNFGRNYATGGWKYDTREVSDADSIANTLQTKKSQTIDLWLAPSSAQALDVASRRLLRTKETPRTVQFATGLQAINTELGDVILVTHLEGIGAAGWIDRAVFVTRHELDPDRLTITLEGIDVDRLFAGEFILGDETTLAASWAAADAADRIYGYLCDETTEEFSDGAAGKRLR